MCTSYTPFYKYLIIALLTGCLLSSCSSSSDNSDDSSTSGSTTASTAGGTTAGNTTAGSTTVGENTTSGATTEGSSTDGETDTPLTDTTQPNILLVITDDQGLDASAQYSLSTDLPNTPIINALASSGITYENAWATPSCTTTRAATLTGFHGINNGVTSTPGILSPTVGSIQSYLSAQASSSNYASAVFGKWHVAGTNPELDHPAQLGIGHYAGNLTGNLTDYYSWDITVNGESSTNDTYHTSAIVNEAISWIGNQTTPWFAWVAFSAPHSPFHVPPEGFNDRGLSGTASDIDGNRRDYFLAAIETLDKELGRLLDNLEPDERENTLIIYIGDNGTPRSVIDRTAYAAPSHSKGSLYEGGVRVPMVISGAGVSRQNERETSLVNIVDFFPTIAEVAGVTTIAERDGFSLVPSFTVGNALQRDHNYTEFISDDPLGSGWTVRTLSHKYIAYLDGSEALYDLTNDPQESTNLLPGSQATEETAASLRAVGLSLRGESGDTNASGPTEITNALLMDTSEDCRDYAATYEAIAEDAATGTTYTAALEISTTTTHCVFQSNAIPNHSFNNGTASFPNSVSEQQTEYLVPINPEFADTATSLDLTYDDAIMLNGVKLDLLAAGCFGVQDGKVGCNNINQPWRYDPMYAANNFRVDQHNAHTQPNGAYHYHGNPNALFDESPDSPSPVIGFAADGFPIYGSYFDDSGTLRKARSSYQLKPGSRPDGANDPGGQYDGTFRDDYEYVESSGDLDECNGMTINGSYGYYVTDGFPHVLACFKGVVDASFRK